MKRSDVLRSSALSLASLLFVANASTQWPARYNHQSLDDFGECVAVDKAGNVYVAGTVDTSGDGKNVVVQSYTAAGVARGGNWPAEYNGAADGDDYATAIHVDDDFNVYIAGTSYGGSTTNYDFFVWKLDTNGSPVWPASGGGSGYAFDSLGAVRTTATTNEGFSASTGVRRIWRYGPRLAPRTAPSPSPA